MKYTDERVTVQPEILKRHTGDELIVPICFTAESFPAGGIIPAGSPIFVNVDDIQVIAVDSESQGEAIGILLNDVTKDNPNGALVKGFAAINVPMAEKNVRARGGVFRDFKYYPTVQEALHNIVFEGIAPVEP